MAKNYSYPRVILNTTTKYRTSAAPSAEDTTILFAPLITETGPEVLTPIHSLGELIETYGDLKYEDNGQMALNVYNWLNNGGTVYVYRLKNEKRKVDETTEKELVADFSAVTKHEEIEYNLTFKKDGFDNKSAKISKDIYDALNIIETKSIDQIKEDNELEFQVNNAFGATDLNNAPTLQYTGGTFELKTETKTITEKADTPLFKAKYFGTYYQKNIEITIRGINDKNVRVSVVNKENGDKEEFIVNEKNYGLAYLASKYVTFWNLANHWNSLKTAAKDSSNDEDMTLVVSTYSPEAAASDKEKYVLDFWTTEAEKVISNKLAAPIDIILDAGYPQNVKEAMHAFIVGENAYRDDITGFFDKWVSEFYNTSATAPQEVTDLFANQYGTNFGVYRQYFYIIDETFTSKGLYVMPSYYLSKILPAIQPQEAPAGLRRGILDDALEIYDNPTPEECETYFKARENYAVKTSREYFFASQRTFDGTDETSYTALSFINNARAYAKMKKEIERLARNYLFEFNDSATLAQMSNVLNKYMTEWVANRTLSYANVTVAKNPYSSEKVDVTMAIKFTGTIEVIEIDITVE